MTAYQLTVETRPAGAAESAADQPTAVAAGYTEYPGGAPGTSGATERLAPRHPVGERFTDRAFAPDGPFTVCSRAAPSTGHV